MNAGAAAFVFDTTGRVLVVKENYGKFRWSLPGGLMEAGETPEAACIREVREETGAEVRVEHAIGDYTLVDGFRARAFRCEIVHGIPALQPTDELSEVCWFAPAEIPQPRSNLLHHALADALAGRRDVVRTHLEKVS